MRRHNPQRGSPASRVTAKGLSSLSPQMAQVPTEIGCMADRQSSQTGRREMLISGAAHRRQSAGNRVANRLSAALLSKETSDVRPVTVLAVEARVGSSLLLKTILPHPVGCCGGLQPDESFFSSIRKYSWLHCAKQRSSMQKKQVSKFLGTVERQPEQQTNSGTHAPPPLSRLPRIAGARVARLAS